MRSLTSKKLNIVKITSLGKSLNCSLDIFDAWELGTVGIQNLKLNSLTSAWLLESEILCSLPIAVCLLWINFLIGQKFYGSVCLLMLSKAISNHKNLTIGVFCNNLILFLKNTCITINYSNFFLAKKKILYWYPVKTRRPMHSHCNELLVNKCSKSQKLLENSRNLLIITVLWTMFNSGTKMRRYI